MRYSLLIIEFYIYYIILYLVHYNKIIKIFKKIIEKYFYNIENINKYKNRYNNIIFIIFILLKLNYFIKLKNIKYYIYVY